jgi:Ca2+-binding RTX toxin-like protein
LADLQLRPLNGGVGIGLPGDRTIVLRGPLTPADLTDDEIVVSPDLPALGLVGSRSAILLGGGSDRFIYRGSTDLLIETPAGSGLAAGGPGNDTIIAGSGTLRLFGGAGSDLFALRHDPATPSGPPPVIEDFDRTEDSIRITGVAAPLTPGDVEIVDGNGNREILVEGTAVAILRGLTDRTGIAAEDLLIA